MTLNGEGRAGSVRYLLVVAFAALTLGVAACGGDDEGDGTTGANGTDTEESGEEVAAESPLGEYDGPEADVPDSYPVPEEKPSKDIVVGIQKVANNEANEILGEAAEAQGEKLGVEVITKNDNVDVDAQVTNMQQLLVQNANGIGVYPLDPASLRPVFQEAAESGVTIMGTDMVQAGTGEELPKGVDSSILFNRDQSAFLQVKEMSRLHPEGRIGIIGLGVPVPALEYYVERVQFWAEEAGLEVLGRENNPNDDVSGGEEAMNALLGKHEEIDGVIAYNDPSALGASGAARQAGRGEITMIGLNGGSDGFAGVDSGRLAATVKIQQAGIAVNFVNGAVVKAMDPSVDLPDLIQIPATLITSENIDEVPTLEEDVERIRTSEGFAFPEP